MAADHQFDGDPRKMASITLSSIDSFRRNRGRLQKPLLQNPRQRSVYDVSRHDRSLNEMSSRSANSIEDSVRRNQRQVEQNRITASMQVEDKAFQEILLKTQVFGACF